MDDRWMMGAFHENAEYLYDSNEASLNEASLRPHFCKAWSSVRKNEASILVTRRFRKCF